MQDETHIVPLFINFTRFYDYVHKLPRAIRTGDTVYKFRDENINQEFSVTGKHFGEIIDMYRMLLKGGRIQIDVNIYKITAKWETGNQQ